MTERDPATRRPLVPANNQRELNTKHPALNKREKTAPSNAQAWGELIFASVTKEEPLRRQTLPAALRAQIAVLNARRNYSTRLEEDMYRSLDVFEDFFHSVNKICIRLYSRYRNLYSFYERPLLCHPCLVAELPVRPIATMLGEGSQGIGGMDASRRSGPWHSEAR